MRGMNWTWTMQLNDDEKAWDLKTVSIYAKLNAVTLPTKARRGTALPADRFQAAIWGKEQGESKEEDEDGVRKPGNHHFQGYIQCKKKQTLNAMICFFSDEGNKATKWGVHLEAAKGSAQQNLDYCSKECGLDNLNTWGELKLGGQGSRNDIHDVGKAIMEGASIEAIANMAPHMIMKYHGGIKCLIEIAQLQAVPNYRAVHVTVYWGKAGAGKTWQASWGETHPSCHEAPTVDWSIRGIPKRWPDYHGEKRLILDDFKDTHMPLGQLMCLLHRKRQNLGYMGSNKLSAWTEVYITSNIDPEQWYSGCEPERRAALKRRIHKVVHFSKDWREQTPVIEDSDEEEGDETDEVVHGPVNRYVAHAMFLFDQGAE